MPNLLTSLISTANALGVFDRALAVSQNNVTNASTPGYATQRLSLQSIDFQPELGLVGGVRAGEIESSRSEYAEQAVRRQLEDFGYFDQIASSVAWIESTFDVSGENGVPGALNRLFQSFSAWAVAPESAAARQTVIERAGELAEAFHQTSATLQASGDAAAGDLRGTVNRINELGEQLLDYNLERRRGALNDAGLDTKIHNALEELAELTDLTTVFQPDGSVTVLVGGQVPLLVGEHFYGIGLGFYSPSEPPPVNADAPPLAHVLDAQGRDVTASIGRGRLGGLLNVFNSLLPTLRGDAYRPGDLNTLATAIADRVNGILTSGYVSDGPPPEEGTALFTYDPAGGTLGAQSLAVAVGLTAGGLAAIDPGPPYRANGVALRLSTLSAPSDDADRIQGLSFMEFYGALGARAGRGLADARDNADFKSQMVAQARSLREEISGVSLDEEAILMVEFQRSYQAAARMVSILNELTETAVNLYR